MLYVTQYTIIAVAASLVLLGLNYQRRSYGSLRNHIFLGMVYFNLYASVADLLTYSTISFPERFPMWVLYGSNILYLILYGTVSASYLIYISALTGVKKYINTAYWVFLGVVALESALLITSPWTHLVFYYDASLTYCHGILFPVFYILPFCLVVNSIFLFLKHKTAFSHYQRNTVVTLTISALLLFSIQLFNSSVDIFHLVCCLIAFTIYVVFENPAYYTHRSTKCFNSKAFYEAANRLALLGLDRNMLLVGVMNRQRNHGLHETILFHGLVDDIAEKLRSRFGSRVFCIAEDILIVILEPDYNTDDINDEIHDLFSSPLAIEDELIRAEVRTRCFRFMEMAISDDFVDHMIEGIQQTPAEQLFSIQNLSTLFLQQHEYRLIEDTVLNAVQDDRFTMVFQPIYDLRDHSYHSAEALIRLKNDEQNYISPELFIPIAEKNRSIIRIGLRIFEKVCSLWAEGRLQAAGLNFIEINVSTVQLTVPDMSRRFIAIMQHYGVPASALNLEITESAEMISNEVFLENIRILTGYGLTLSIDDYGSGFASTDYLFRLPITIVKIDKSILWQAMKDDTALTLFQNTVRMLKQLNKDVVVEGAEDTAMVQLIETAGADYIQGYYFSRPLDYETLLEFNDRSHTG